MSRKTGAPLWLVLTLIAIQTGIASVVIFSSSYLEDLNLQAQWLNRKSELISTHARLINLAIYGLSASDWEILLSQRRQSKEISQEMTRLLEKTGARDAERQRLQQEAWEKIERTSIEILRTRAKDLKETELISTFSEESDKLIELIYREKQNLSSQIRVYEARFFLFFVAALSLGIVVTMILGRLVIIRLVKPLEEQRAGYQNLLRVLCHDLSSPLYIINHATNDLDRQYPGNKDISRLIRSETFIRKLIEKVKTLDYANSNKSKLKLDWLDPGGLLEDINLLYHEQFESKGVKLSVQNHLGPSALIYGDRVVLVQQIIGNLLTNAVKFSEPSTCVNLTFEETDGDLVLIKIRDQGVGIPQDLLQRIFSSDRPTTRLGTKGEKGTGFGMPIVRSFVLKLGGNISIRSQTEGPERGTTVEVRLLLRQEQVSAA